MSDLQIDTGGGNVLDCIQVVEDVVMKYGDEIDAVCWQRLKKRLTPDRERLTDALQDTAIGQAKNLDHYDARRIVDAVITAMGEAP